MTGTAAPSPDDAPSHPAASSRADRGPTMIEVWDPVVRLGHWVLVGGFLTAYLTEGEPEWLHTGAGYAVAATVGLRVVWGFIGPQHARFTDFVRAPRHALAYLSGLASGSAPRFVGHNPAGGLMALALLASLGATAFTGMAMIAQEGEGPLAPFMGPAATASVAIVSPALADDHEWSEHRDGRSGSETGEGWEEAHELFANLTLILMALHLFGVIASSLAHRENLVRAMIDGRKAT